MRSLYEKLNRLDDSLVESKRIIKNKKLTEGYRVDPKISKFNVGDRVAERYNDSEFNVGTIIKINKGSEGTQYLVKWDYSDREDEEWLYGDVLSLWVEDEYDDDIDEMLTESTEQYELSTLVKDSINHLVNDLGKDSMADDFGDDVCADLEDNYDIDVPQNPVKYADWCHAVKWEVSKQVASEYDDLGIDTRTGKPFGIHYDIDAPEYDNIDEMLTEGNNVSSQISPAIDSFLQDIAQMYKTIDYKDIMQHEYSEDDIRRLKNLRRRFIAEADYEGTAESDAILQDIAERVAKIVKNNMFTENRNNPYFSPYGYRDAAKVLNGKAPEYYYHLKEIEMDRGDGVKLARYAMKKGLPVMVEKDSDPDYPQFAIEGEYHWDDYFYPYPTTHEEDLIAWDGKMFVEEALTEGAPEVCYLDLFSKDGKTFEQSFSTCQEAEEEGNFSLENNPMTKEYIIYDKNHKLVKHKR